MEKLASLNNFQKLIICFIGLSLSFGFVNPTEILKVKIDKILVLKSKRKLQLFSKVKLVKQYSISLGGNPKGHKQFEGDQKTPEGLYLVAP